MDETTAILRRLTEEAPIPADPWEGFRRRRRRRQAASRVRAAVVALVVFTGASIFLVKAFDSSVPSVAQPSVAQGGIGSVDRGNPPLAGGVEVTLAQAESMTGLLALLPDTSLASTSSITQVWARSRSPDMLVIYKSGVQAEVRRWSIAQTPDEHWKALMSDGLPGSIVTLNGQDVYVMPPGGQGGTGSTNFVTADGTWVSIYGEGVASASQLLDMAATASTPSASSSPRLSGGTPILRFNRYFFAASGVRGVLEVSSSPPSICYSTQSYPARPISIIAEPPYSLSRTEVSYAPSSGSFCDRTVHPALVTDLLAHPSAYRVRWRPRPGAITAYSSLTAEATPPLVPRP